MVAAHIRSKKHLSCIFNTRDEVWKFGVDPTASNTSKIHAASGRGVTAAIKGHQK